MYHTINLNYNSFFNYLQDIFPMNAIEYLRLLRLTKDLYQFRKIGSTRKSEISEMISNDLLICFLRHDIDFGPKSAFDMAQMEEENPPIEIPRRCYRKPDICRKIPSLSICQCR